MTRFDFTKGSALVTGATSGIGLALIRQLKCKGMKTIVALGRDAQKLAALNEQSNGFFKTMIADLSKQSEVNRVLECLPVIAPDLRLVINNAAIQVGGDLTSNEARSLMPQLKDEIDTNFSAVVSICVGTLQLLRRSPDSTIVNVTSALALAPKKSSPVYCATKAAVRSFTRSLRYQCASLPSPIQIIEAMPPLVDTKMTEGRGGKKLDPDECARQILIGIETGKPEILIGKSKLLAALMRVSPSAAYRLMQNG